MACAGQTLECPFMVAEVVCHNVLLLVSMSMFFLFLCCCDCCLMFLHDLPWFNWFGHVVSRCRCFWFEHEIDKQIDRYIDINK